VTPFALLYAAAALAATLTADLGPRPVALVLKGIPVLLLAIATGLPLFRGGAARARFFLSFGFAFSLLGDLAIEFVFVAGIAAFLLAHVFYIVAMGWEREKPGRQAAAALPALALAIGMSALLVPRAPAELRAPVVVYLTVISVMWARSTIRAFVTRGHTPSRWMFAGATVFVVSDSLIAIDKWVVALPHASLLVLGTYYVAQWLIRRGAEAAD